MLMMITDVAEVAKQINALPLSCLCFGLCSMVILKGETSKLGNGCCICLSDKVERALTMYNSSESLG